MSCINTTYAQNCLNPLSKIHVQIILMFVPCVDIVHEITNNVYVRPAKSQISLIRAFASCLKYSMTVKLLTERHLEFLSLKGGCTGLYMSTLVKMPHCWKSHVAAHFFYGDLLYKFK